MTLVTNESWKDQSGNKQERAEFHNVLVFGKTADYALEHLKKGDMILAEGKIQYGSYENKDGVKITTAEIKASRIDRVTRGNASKNALPQNNATGQQTTLDKEMDRLKDSIPQSSPEYSTDDLPF